MRFYGLYGRILSAFYAKCIKSIDSWTSCFIKDVIGEKKHFRLTNYIVHKSRLMGKYIPCPRKCLDKGGKTVILLFDGSFSSPGLADILRSICSVYDWCIKNDCVFKLLCTKPFNMFDYLIPNQYDWTIEADELDYRNATPYAIFSYNDFYGEKQQLVLQKYCLDRILKCRTKQVHLYSNLCCYDSFFYARFHDLFKMENTLEKEIIRFQNEIGSEYITISFRFTQLLGDLKDSFAAPLSDDEKQRLIQVCVDSIKPIIKKNNVNKTIVTSDSRTFLHEVEKLPYVYLLPGEPDHINNSESKNDAVRKTFWDMFMIANAKKAYMVRTSIMYKSGFAKRAAMIGNVPFEEIVI